MESKSGKTKIMVFGTFDGIHKGHLEFLKQARRLAENPYLIVSIARDANVMKIKGERPHFKEKIRAGFVSGSGLADKVVLSGLRNHIPHIVKEGPEIIALGYDQRAYVKNLKENLESRKIYVKIRRLRPYKKNIYKNHLIRR